MAEILKDGKRQIKKRIRNPAEWKREKRKRLRVAGKSYVNSRGDIVNERRIGADCNCRRKCYSRVPEDQRNKLFDGYYSLNSHDEQNAYLFGLIRKHDIARKKCKESDRRTCSYKYYVRIRGKEIQICRLAFANIHGISPHKIRILCQKQDQNIMFPRDGRGKHSNRPRKISQNTVQNIKHHIYSIISSDRIGEFLREEKHFGPNVNITKMWKDYLEKYDPNYGELFLEDDKGNNQRSKDNSLDTNCALLGTLPENEILDDPGMQHFPAIDLSEYPIPTVPDTLDILDQSMVSQFSETNNVETDSETKNSKHDPIVKHWLYSKVFHEELKINDYMALRKKLHQMKDVVKAASSNPQNSKSERKQKTPKKIPREKNQIHTKETDPIPNPVSSLGYGLDVSSSDIPNVGAGQNADMYLLPVNLQDLAPLQHSEVSGQSAHAHTLHFNLHSNVHSFSAINSSAPAQNLQCSTVLSLPSSGSAVNFSQNTCGYMNLNMAAFY